MAHVLLEPGHKKHFTSQEAAKFLGINKTTLLRWEREKIIPAPVRIPHGGQQWRRYTAQQLRRIHDRIRPRPGQQQQPLTRNPVRIWRKDELPQAYESLAKGCERARERVLYCKLIFETTGRDRLAFVALPEADRDAATERPESKKKSKRRRRPQR